MTGTDMTALASSARPWSASRRTGRRVAGAALVLLIVAALAVAYAALGGPADRAGHVNAVHNYGLAQSGAADELKLDQNAQKAYRWGRAAVQSRLDLIDELKKNRTLVGAGPLATVQKEAGQASKLQKLKAGKAVTKQARATPATTVELSETALRVRLLTAQQLEQTKTTRTVAGKLNTEIKALDADFAQLAKTVPAASQKILAANGYAPPAARAAFSRTVDSVRTAKGAHVVVALAAYVKTAVALKAADAKAKAAYTAYQDQAKSALPSGLAAKLPPGVTAP